MEVRWKVWLAEDGEKVFGSGPRKLLSLVDELGSMNRAAAEMGMSYSKAIKLVKNIEAHTGAKVLERQTGGESGGGSILTEEARELMAKFDRFEEAVGREVEALYRECF